MSIFRRRLIMMHREQQIIHFHDLEVKRILVEKYGGATGGELGNVAGYPGEITHKQASQITYIGPKFDNPHGEGGLLSHNNKIVSLEDLKYLRRLNTIDWFGLVSLPNLEHANFANIEYIGNGFLAWGNKLKNLNLPNLREITRNECITSWTDIETIDIGPYARRFMWLSFFRIPTLKRFILRAITPPQAPVGWLGPTERVEDWYGKLYVPDESVTLYKNTDGYQYLSNHIHPLSEYEQ